MDNDRIQELADQCWDYGRGIVNTRKFAYAIIKECAQLVQGVPTDTMGYHTADQKIKQHFGIE